MSKGSRFIVILILGVSLFAGVAWSQHREANSHRRRWPDPRSVRSYHVVGLDETLTVIESAEGVNGFMIKDVLFTGGNAGDAQLFEDVGNGPVPILRIRTNVPSTFRAGIPVGVGATITAGQSGLYGVTISGFVF